VRSLEREVQSRPWRTLRGELSRQRGEPLKYPKAEVFLAWCTDIQQDQDNWSELHKVDRGEKVMASDSGHVGDFTSVRIWTFTLLEMRSHGRAESRGEAPSQLRVKVVPWLLF
jgi:hypothetical protein